MPLKGEKPTTHTSIQGHGESGGGLCLPPMDPSTPGQLGPGAPTQSPPDPPESVLTLRPDLVETIRGYVTRGRVKATDRAYASDWRIFEEWCRGHGACPLPATIDTVLGFIADHAKGRSLATLRRYRATISKRHKLAGLPSPVYDTRVRDFLKGVIDEKTERSPHAKAAVTAEVFSQMLDKLGHEHVRDVRDRAILLFGIATALRRAEIVAVDFEDLTWRDEGVAVLVRRSKTDQAGAGRYTELPRSDENPARCPIRALHAWISFVKDHHGPVFRSLEKGGEVKNVRLPAEEVAEAVKRAAETSGLDPTQFAGHSLRSGYVTQARREGVSWGDIMEKTGHTKIETVKRYAREPTEAFRAGHVDQVFKAFAERDNFGLGLHAGREWRVLRAALERAEIDLRAVTLPPSYSLDERLSFSGGVTHQRLCSSAARWLAMRGKRWTADAKDLDYAGGKADVAAKDGSIFVEAGDTSSRKVIKAIEAGQTVLLVPFSDDGVVGYLLAPSLERSASLKAFSDAEHAELRAAVESLSKKWDPPSKIKVKPPREPLSGEDSP